MTTGAPTSDSESPGGAGRTAAPSTGADNPLHESVACSGDALLGLGAVDPVLATRLAKLVDALAREASRSARLRRAMSGALSYTPRNTEGRQDERKPNRRSPGVLDPFAIYAEHGETGLRTALSRLDLEQLRDILAEHGMDRDRLAMKWKDLARVTERIVETVTARSEKGSAFREM